MELTILNLLNSYAVSSATARGIAAFVGHTLPPFLVGAAALFLLLMRGVAWREKIAWVLEALGAGVVARFGVTALIRLLYYRPRPFEAHQEIVRLIARGGNGFPSGHMAFLFAFATMVWYFRRRIGWWLYGISMLVGVSRIAAGVHYPSDIVGGAVVGVFVGFAAHRLMVKLKSGKVSLEIFHDSKKA